MSNKNKVKMEFRLKASGRFVLEHYKTDSDAKSAENFSEEQIMNALNKSASFNVKDWYGNIQLVTFTITNIEKDKFGCYIYTIKSSHSINKRYFPLISQICDNCTNVAFPTLYTMC